ncbi:MAG: 23S rRNA (adenine(2503)-C(2))-methyltransferase RlmN [Bacteroidia bacterium]|nr:23S rRNA (adenine(2503)-C(2))-methyltransferase RlmN [Bacteroidia bacterium]
MPGNQQKQDIRELNYTDILSFFTKSNDKLFRAKQVYEWLWKKGAASFDEMTNLPKETRNALQQHFSFNRIAIEKTQQSKDRTIKTAFRLHDGEIIEGVLIPTENRSTACISTQVGCPLACKFCATGSLKFKRNLSAAEMFDHVILIRKQAQENYRLTLTNIVIMGMGEPLLNYENVMRAIGIITSKEGLDMSPDRITVSTAGIPKMIKMLGDENIKFNLSVSLHTANDIKRSSIMPVNKRHPVEAIKDAIIYFYQKTHIRITLEYLLLDNFNDGLNDAKELALFCKNFPCKINIIEYNSNEYSLFKKSGEQKTKAFAAFLESKNLIVNIRKSRGKDIDAACGQLANKKHVVIRQLADEP